MPTGTFDNDAAVVADLAQQAATRAPSADFTYEPARGPAWRSESFVVPDGYDLVTATNEALLTDPRLVPNPIRATGTSHVHDPAALADYTLRHKTDSTIVWADIEHGRITAVLNDHATDLPGWRDHRAQLTLTHSEDWRHWHGRNNAWFTQEEFAEHIEAGLGAIMTPEPATMLELAQTFEAKKDVDFKSTRRLSNGQVELRYEENIEAKAGGNGTIEIPKTFRLALPVYDASNDNVELDARLRYRISQQGLKLGYVLTRPDLAVRQAFDLVVDAVTGLLTFIQPDPVDPDNFDVDVTEVPILRGAASL